MWGLVNNAGISTFGEVEFTSMETYKEVAEVNLWGTVRMTKSFLPLIRRAKGESERDLPPAPRTCPTFSSLLRMERGLSRSSIRSPVRLSTWLPGATWGPWMVASRDAVARWVETDMWLSDSRAGKGHSLCPKG